MLLGATEGQLETAADHLLNLLCAAGFAALLLDSLDGTDNQAHEGLGGYQLSQDLFPVVAVVIGMLVLFVDCQLDGGSRLTDEGGGRLAGEGGSLSHKRSHNPHLLRVVPLLLHKQPGNRLDQKQQRTTVAGSPLAEILEQDALGIADQPVLEEQVLLVGLGLDCADQLGQVLWVQQEVVEQGVPCFQGQGLEDYGEFFQV